ncbi:acyltransferase family protein [Salinicoccus albus]|uniref:acyltransferase family protein n=1 Tax=Salinicoccus albus TaxID=418756 RepID=UPI00036CFDD1|nr:acyltransferase family protein [Salinicoccus albus]
MEIKKQYRPEIEGLRLIAALLVAIYHIWMMRVSGGVDVFFVVSGFLITTSLLSKYAKDGYIKFFTFISGLLKRLLPQALTVLIFVTVAGYFILPEVRHLDTIKEIFASLFYYENWQLAMTGTDYLDQNNVKSPVQHFWAMSIQGQFYIIWFLIISATIFVYNKTKFEMKNILLTIFIVLFAVSLSYSIYLTEVNQPWAYFDTRTRVWEFTVGGILMMYIYKIKLPAFISTFIGWAGMIALMSTGLIMDVGASFPSYIALWPVTAAIFVMLAGQNPAQFGVEKFLGSRPMIYLGGLSYGLYLWHWPLLSFYYVIFDTTDVGLVHGVIIILLSLLLSYVTTKFIEKPINAFIKEKKFTLRSFSPIIAMAGVLIVLAAGWLTYNQYQSSYASSFVNDNEYPGAMANTEAVNEFEPKDPIPDLAAVKDDKAEPYEDGCHIGPGTTEVEICEYGEVESPDYTVAVVGGSKSTHWLPSLRSFAEEESIKVLNVTKSGCLFSLSDNQEADCNEWNRNVVDEVAAENPDLIVTLADSAHNPESVPEGFLKQFEKAEEYNIPILAIRDTPHFGKDIPECLSANGINTEECNIDRDEMYPDPSAWEKLDNPPTNVHYADYTDYVCNGEECSPVIGNVIAYLDGSHMTATFSRTLGPIIHNDVIEILGNTQSDETESATESSTEQSADSGSEDSNLLENTSTEPGWINFSGESGGNPEYVTTSPIEYNPDKEYELNEGAYIAYYNGDEFLETVQKENASTLEAVPEADHIRISYHESFEEKLELTEK